MATQWLSDRITIDPERCSGRPTIRGTRMRVLDILEMLGDGMSEADILSEFPDLEQEDVRAALKFAAEGVELMRFPPELSQETEAAIERGWQDSQAGRVVSLEEGFGQLREKWRKRAMSRTI
jgi:uncharacterized protein (DUF433 family)